MNLQLTNKVAIVTGASRGIGRAIAEELASEQMRLVLVARSGDLLKEVAASVGTECLVHVADLRQPDAAAEVIAAAMQRFGGIDVLVNNAGATKRGDFLELNDADWNNGFALKFFGAMRLCRAAWPHLMASHGSIINIIGVGGRTASADFAIGGSVNSALLNLTKALAHRGLADGVRVNAINPGAIATERLQHRIKTLAAEQGLDYETAAKAMLQELGVTRFGTPAEIAHAVAFLASPSANYCQGTIMDVDGGHTRTL
ncbi:MAG: SDR family oxidoreductase [Verrucomicrobiia bacterium]|jgi:3-oxoacyl-[acyl-carrier protein] reductase